MTESNQKGYLYAGRKLAEFVSMTGREGLEQFDILNTNDASAKRLAYDISAKSERFPIDSTLRDIYGIASNPFALTLVRLIAFRIINTRSVGFSWYESPLLGTIKERKAMHS